MRPVCPSLQIREDVVIGTNRDLKSLQHSLDTEFAALNRLADHADDQSWIPVRLAAVTRWRIAISTTLANRRIEATKQIVDLSRWYDGNGALGAVIDCGAGMHKGRPTLTA
jgi:hypothetical protein